MFRRQIFYGITLILLVVILFLLMRGRSSEKERQAQNIKLEEIASEAPSPVRAILPRDLEIIEAEVSWTRNPDEKNASEAHHGVIIRNTGGGSYSRLRLRMEYIDKQSRSVEIRTFEVSEALPPGGTLRVSDIIINNLPDAASDFRASILSADLEGS
jgi:hypothetical protein